MLEELNDRRISCSGITLGTTAAVRDYVERLASQLVRHASCQIVGTDQGIHNFLIWSGQVADLHFIDIPDGSVAHYLTAEDGPVVDGAVVAIRHPERPPYAIVHQYDRRDDLLHLFFDKAPPNSDPLV